MLRNLNQSYPRGRILGTNHSGVLASTIPKSGDNGASLLDSSILSTDPVDCEYRVEIVTWPASGDLFVYEDGSFDFSNAADGTYTGTKRTYKNGVDSGTSNYTFIVGGNIPALTGASTADGSLANISTSGSSTTINASSALASGLGIDSAVKTNVTISSITADAVGNGLTSLIAQNVIINAVKATAVGYGQSATASQVIMIGASIGSASATGLSSEIINIPSNMINCYVGNGTASGVLAAITGYQDIPNTIGNLSLAQKQDLEARVAAGAQVFTLVYDPTNVIGSPEGDAQAAGLVQYYKEAAPTMVQVIYTKG